MVLALFYLAITTGFTLCVPHVRVLGLAILGPISVVFGCFTASLGCQLRAHILTAHSSLPTGRTSTLNQWLCFLSIKHSLFFTLCLRAFSQLHLAAEAMWRDWLTVASPLLEPLQVSCREKSQKTWRGKERDWPSGVGFVSRPMLCSSVADWLHTISVCRVTSSSHRVRPVSFLCSSLELMIMMIMINWTS